MEPNKEVNMNQRKKKKLKILEYNETSCQKIIGKEKKKNWDLTTAIEIPICCRNSKFWKKKKK